VTAPPRDPLDLTLALGTGRSERFPFPQWRARDRFRTVYFDVGAGPPLVLVHGLGGNATHWELVAGALAEQHRVVALDLVGCGWSAKPDRDYSVALLRHHLLQFCDDHDLAGATLVGHSLGGAVCAAAALRRPGHFRSLALVCPAGLVPTQRLLRLATTAVLRRRLLYPYFRYASTMALQSWFVDRARDNPDVRWFLDSTVQDATGGENLKAMSRVTESLVPDLLRGETGRGLEALDLPVLAMLTEADRLTNTRQARRALDRIPRVRRVTVPACGHLPFVERPAQFLAHLRRFISDQATLGGAL